MSDEGRLLDEARAWAAADPDTATRSALDATIAAAVAGDATAAAELADAFAGPLEFGTAGLRGRLGPGPNRMNEVVVARAAAGLAAYVREQGGGSIVIGYDARHNSARFAQVTGDIVTGAGLAALLLPRALPTPVLAFAIRHLGAAAGVMVTASHNPREDNGYKVYLGDGRQIVPPADADISAHIAAATALGPVAGLLRGAGTVVLGDDVLAAYLDRVAGVVSPEARTAAPLRVVYTPLHGVGGAVFRQAVERAGLPAPDVVVEQDRPDPDFPTVAFPNPEEPGALDLALDLARTQDADLVIANDPDADRCAVAVPLADGTWRALSGDEVGWLLGAWIASRPDVDGVLAQSIVSGSMLARIAEDAGLDYAQTLTGFKWISRVPGLVFGYEEALGYCVDPDGVADKDGISAALLVIDIATRLRDRGSHLLAMLDDLAARFGVHLTAQVSVRLTDLSRVAPLLHRLTDAPPSTIGGSPLRSVDDLSVGADGLPPTPGVRLHADGGIRVIVRPSGTEPKVKCYLQIVEAAGDGDVPSARARAQARLDAVRDEVAGWLT